MSAWPFIGLWIFLSQSSPFQILTHKYVRCKHSCLNESFFPDAYARDFAYLLFEYWFGALYVHIVTLERPVTEFVHTTGILLVAILVFFTTVEVLRTPKTLKDALIST